MNRKTMIAIVFGFITAAALFTGCKNFTTPYGMKIPKPEPGMGTVVVSFTTGRSALSPASMDFDSYEFIFSEDGVSIDPITKNKSDSDNFTFTLPSGDGYSLTVNVYKGTVKVASGSSPESFNVGSDKATTVPITLSGFTNGEGKGIFTYSVTYPEGAIITQFDLIADGKTIPLNKAGTDTPISIDAGWYFLVITLENGRAVAGYANGVLIYTGQTTNFEKGFTAEEFQIPPGSSDPVLNWDSNGETFAVTGGDNIYYYIDSNDDILPNILSLNCTTDTFSYDASNTGIYNISLTYKDGADKWTTVEWPFRVDDKTNTINMIPDGVSGAILVKAANVTFGEDLLKIVNPPIEIVAGNEPTMTVNIGNDKVTWKSSDITIATIDANGLVKAIKNGSVDITATSIKYPALNSDTATVTVCDDNLVIELTWDPTTFSFITGLAGNTTSVIRPGIVTLSAPNGSAYQWYVDGIAVSDATEQTFEFKSAKYLPKTYNIGLKIGSVGGDAVQIVVTDK